MLADGTERQTKDAQALISVLGSVHLIKVDVDFLVVLV